MTDYIFDNYNKNFSWKTTNCMKSLTEPLDQLRKFTFLQKLSTFFLKI